MPIIVYDLVGQDDRRFSPYCWRTRMALAHKGLAHETVPTRFSEIPRIAGGGFKTVPTIEDGATRLGDSWAIACYLEDAYPERPSLFGGPGGRVLVPLIHNWTGTEIHARVTPLILLDIHDQLPEGDRAYFRASREERLGRRLEEIQVDRARNLESLRAALAPLRSLVRAQPFIGGDAPHYADYVVFGALQWPRMVSAFPMLAADDPVAAWFERILDLHEGYARRDKPFADGTGAV